MGLIEKDIRELKNLKTKRTLILFFLNFILIILVASFLLLWKLAGIDVNLLVTIYTVVALILVAIVIYLREYFSILDMKYKYLVMVQNKREPYKLKKPIYSQEWIDSFIKNEGFKLQSDAQNYSIYHKYIKVDRKVALVKKAMVIVVIAKNESVDFYADEIDKKIKKVYHGNEYDKTEKHIVLQFKQYEALTPENILEIDQIINFRSGRFHAVQITCGYFPKTKEVYFLEPKRKYPSKFYYYACSLIKKYVGVLSNEKE
ncbi:MAG: hypothetical protein ACOX56_01695 [Acholeplasmataceae bacterium]